ncbi:TetR/AcrR family transcriptional regulator [Phenylobacterium sp.]|jgi:AcrR family transcriptional regulator|uniref:TetR/AcrR family transcriptional regulator n=1 Tax=Phenylobacterium sp. TaxID=1871053 RepID=UPI002F41FF20
MNRADTTDQRPKPLGIRERNRIRTYNDIYDSAMLLFERKDYEDVTVDEICEAAGISKATFFRYFTNKFGLVDEFNQRIARKIEVDLEKRTRSASESLIAATDTLYEEWLHTAVQMRNLTQEFLRSGVRVSPENGADPMARNLIALLSRVIADGQKSGEFIREADPQLVASMVVYAWGMATSLWFAHDDRVEFRQLLRSLVNVIVRGLVRSRDAKS